MCPTPDRRAARIVNMVLGSIFALAALVALITWFASHSVAVVLASVILTGPEWH